MARRLPVLPTQFRGVDVPLFDGLSLFVDGNSKITAENGSYEHPVPNAFSLPHVSTCPGSTPVCRENCYVHGLEEKANAVYQRYRENERTLHRLLTTYALSTRASDAFAKWISGKVTSFRWHVSGDVFSPVYAEWIVDVCLAAPNVRFWIYTRSLWAVELLQTAKNLVVNISADRDNWKQARDVSGFTGARLCYMATRGEDDELGISDLAESTVPRDLPPGSVIFPDYALRGRDLKEPRDAPWWQSMSQAQREMTCPADFFGQSESYRCGVCTRCMVQP